MHLFLTASIKITSGEISAKEAAEERIWAGRTPRRKPRVPDAPRSGMLKHIKINAHKSDRVNVIILKHKISKELENNA